MSNKLIFSLLFITLIITIFIIKIPKKPGTISSPIPLITLSPTPTLVPESTLSFIPDTLYVPAGQNGQANIQLTSQGQYPTAAQLELAYDPEILTEVVSTPGTLFPKQNILLNNNDESSGRISFALSLDKNEKPQNLSGIITSIKFKIQKNTTQNQTAIYFLPKTAIISQDNHIPLKIAYGLKILLNPAASASPTLK